MTYKTILVHSDASDGATPRLDVASGLARRFHAQLVGLHIREPFLPPGAFDPAVRMDALLAIYEDKVRSDREKSRALFDKAIEGQWQSAEWSSIEGPTETLLAAYARTADLVVVSKAGETVNLGAGLPELVALWSGRSVVVVPRSDFRRSVGRTVLLCWNGSREAARAAWDALPILKNAAKVILLGVDESKFAGFGLCKSSGTVEAATWLSRHGIKATPDRTAAEQGDVGNAILAYATAHEVDLIVMGLYGHSRVREFVLGGASRTILSSAKVPLFISH